MKYKIKHPPIFSLYQTYALSGIKKIDPITKATLPTEEDVIAAKEWVDYNKL